MQIKYLHRNMYKQYAWARTQECLDAFARQIGRIGPQKGTERRLKIARGHALQIKPRYKRVQAFAAAHVFGATEGRNKSRSRVLPARSRTRGCLLLTAPIPV